ncbi:MAG TPA: hypothetical protein VFW96_02905 [Thermomicrobiales bacterium]|nr:hypothetical protein [Thermomicrobiales bacterium]
MDGATGGIAIRRRTIVAGAAESTPATRRAPRAGHAAGILRPGAALRLALLGAATGVLAGGALAQLGLPAALRRLPAPRRVLGRLPAPAATRRLPF